MQIETQTFMVKFGSHPDLYNLKDFDRYCVLYFLSFRIVLYPYHIVSCEQVAINFFMSLFGASLPIKGPIQSYFQK